MLDKISRRFWRIISRSSGIDYATIKVTQKEIENEAYKKYLGGQAPKWEGRGRFQLDFLRKMGLRSNSKLLDVGCGPGRAAVHFIDFLQEGNYTGVDNNEDFIAIARRVMSHEQLARKRPIFMVISNFDFSKLPDSPDYVMAFSVLNHCSPKLRMRFFKSIDSPLRVGSKIFISHARWFTPDYLSESGLRVCDEHKGADFNASAYGWDNGDEISPILELIKV